MPKTRYFKTDKNLLAVMALDMFTKIFCIKDEEDLDFECKNCEFYSNDKSCAVKMFARSKAPTYRDFGSMGDL